MPPNDAVDFGLPPGTKVGEYTLIEQIGAGGWGIVYKARGPSNRIVAIKEFYPQAIVRNPRSGGSRMQVTNTAAAAFEVGLKNFEEEAHRLEAATHRSIVKALGYVEQDKTGYLIMSFVEGSEKDEAAPTLQSTVPIGVTMAAPRVRRLCDELMSALEYLHDRGIIHRDIAPDNILMAGLRNEDPIIIDLGGSRSVTAYLSNTMEALVKPGFTPLEQYAAKYANEKPPEPSADIYATAAVLYRVITGKNPVEAVTRALSGSPNPPLIPAQFPSFDPKFLDAIEQALSLRASDRPQSIAAWRELMSHGMPIVQPPPKLPWWRRAFEWAFRGSLPLKFAALVVACLIAGYILGNV